MSNKPTKILLYDLDPELIELINQLTSFQGDYGTLLERLNDLTPDTFDDETQAVIEDLINGFQDGGVHIVQRVANLKSELEAKLLVTGMDSGNFQEIFTYDPEFGNVTRHQRTGDGATNIVYNYADASAGRLSTSVQTFTNTAGENVTITKTYTYDLNDNITNISTATTASSPV